MTSGVQASGVVAYLSPAVPPELDSTDTKGEFIRHNVPTTGTTKAMRHLDYQSKRLFSRGGMAGYTHTVPIMLTYTMQSDCILVLPVHAHRI